MKTLPLQEKANGSDRRRWQRLPLAIPVFVRGVDQSGKNFLEFATALDISAGGALLASRKHIPQGTQITLEIPCAAIPDSKVSRPAIQNYPAKLVRVEAGDQHLLMGLKFSKPLVAKRRAKADG